MSRRTLGLSTLLVDVSRQGRRSMLVVSTAWGGVEREPWVRGGGMKIGWGLPGTSLEKQELTSGGGGGRHSQGTREPEQISAPVPCGTGSGTSRQRCLVTWSHSAGWFVWGALQEGRKDLLGADFSGFG